MAYFDECVSLSTLDSSDFSAPEDPPRYLVGGKISRNNLNIEALDNYSNKKQVTFWHINELKVLILLEIGLSLEVYTSSNDLQS